jgi:hypothetical protein
MIESESGRVTDPIMGPPPGGMPIGNVVKIEQQPTSATVQVGASHTFSVRVLATQPKSIFQWQVRDFRSSTPWQNVSTTNTQTISPVNAIHGSLEWRVVISIPGVAGSSVISNIVRLTVTQ